MLWRMILLSSLLPTYKQHFGQNFALNFMWGKYLPLAIIAAMVCEKFHGVETVLSFHISSLYHSRTFQRMALTNVWPSKVRTWILLIEKPCALRGCSFRILGGDAQKWPQKNPKKTAFFWEFFSLSHEWIQTKYLSTRNQHFVPPEWCMFFPSTLGHSSLGGWDCGFLIPSLFFDSWPLYF